MLAVTHDRWFARSFDRFLVFGVGRRVLRVGRAGVGRERGSCARAAATESPRLGIGWHVSDIEIGRAKRGRACVRVRRHRDRAEPAHPRPARRRVSWTIDAFTFDIPVLAAPMDSVVSPATAIAIGQLGGLGVLDLEGVWTRYDDPEPVLAEIRGLPGRRRDDAHAGDLLRADQAGARHGAPRRDPRRGRARRRRAQPAAHAGALQDRRRCRRRPVRHPRHHGQRRARVEERRAPQPQEVHLRARRARDRRRRRHLHGRTAPHAHRRRRRARRLRRRRRIDDARSLGIHAPMATAVADVAGARRDYLDESGGRYVHVIADGGLGTSGDIVKAISVRRRRRDARFDPRARDGRPGRRLALGRRGAPPRAAARQPRGGRHGRPARGDAVRAGTGGRRHASNLDRRAAPVDGDDRLLRPQGVPARRGRRRRRTTRQS